MRYLLYLAGACALLLAGAIALIAIGPSVNKDVIIKANFTWVSAHRVTASFVFFVENTYDYDIRDVRIACTFYGASGTQVGNVDVTIYEIVQAHQRRSSQQIRLKVPPQTAKHKCEARDYSRVDFLTFFGIGLGAPTLSGFQTIFGIGLIVIGLLRLLHAAKHFRPSGAPNE
jgi:hypothetical protein